MRDLIYAAINYCTVLESAIRETKCNNKIVQD